MEIPNNGKIQLCCSYHFLFESQPNLCLALLQTLPAIRFDAQRQRRRFFSIWRDRLPERMDENQAIEHDRLRLLGKRSLEE